MPLPLSKRDLVIGDFDWTRMALLGEGVVDLFGTHQVGPGSSGLSGVRWGDSNGRK